MALSYTPRITTAGLAAAALANGAGLQVHITHIALGAGAYTPTGAETDLADRREVATIDGGVASGAQCTITSIVRSAAYAGAPYDIGEIGFYLGDPTAGGTLFAVVSTPAPDVYGSRSSTAVDFVATFYLSWTGVPAGSVSITVDPNAGLAGLLMTNHLQASNPHNQYLLKAGGTMTGPIQLPGNATTALQAVPLQQAQALLAGAYTVLANAGVPYGFKAGTVIVQWASATFSDIVPGTTGATANVTWGTPFPTACLACFPTATPDPGSVTNWSTAVTSKTLTGATVKLLEWSGEVNTGTVYVLAFGY